MKTSVRFLSMLLAILMIAGTALTASATETEATENKEALELLVDLGIIGGYDDGSLKPENLVERDEMAKIIFVLYTTFSDAGAGVVSFNDVAADNWAAGYISWCSSNGIVGGYGDGNFGPDDKVTYDQALKMVCGALGYTDWDSKVWPIDVRQKGLKDLGLGENISGIKGTDYVTRAQVAQMVYNALFTEMNETKTVKVDVTGDQGQVLFSIPTQVPKVLAVDTWNFGEKYAVITAAGLVNADLLTEEESDVYVAGVGEFTLEELGLEEYKNDIADLMFANVRFIYDATKDAIDAESIVAVSVTPTVEKNLAYEVDFDKREVLVSGNEIADDAVVVTVDENGDLDTAPYTGFGNSTSTIPPQLVEFIKALTENIEVYAYDLDEDGKYDVIYDTYKIAIEVTDVTEDKITAGVYGEANSEFDILAEELISNVALKEDDVVVVKPYYNYTIVEEVVAPVAAKATKYSGTKLTLEGVGEVAINEPVFIANAIKTIDKSVMDLNDKGETAEYTYYIYNGEVFGADITVEETDLEFAVLSYINQPSEAVFNPVTKDFDTSYTAVVTIGGKEQTVNIDPTNTIDGLNMLDNGEEILAKYGKAFTKDGVTADAEGKYLLKHYELVTYTVSEEGYYTFETNAQSEDYTIYAEGATIEYNKKVGLYSIKAADGTVLAARAEIDPAALLYYTYTLEKTGVHAYLGTYTAADLPEGMVSVSATSKIYATVDEETGFVQIKLAVLDNETVKTDAPEKANYKTDSREIFYCYQNSNETMASDGRNLNYTYFWKPINVKDTHLAETTNTELTAAEGAISASAGKLYAWDDELKGYVQISKSTLEELEVESIGMYTITDVINGCIITEGGSKYADGVKVPADACIWALKTSTTLSAYNTLTLDNLAEIVDIAEEGNATVRAIIGTYVDANGDEVISTIIIEQYKYDSDGNVTNNNKAIHNEFNQ